MSNLDKETKILLLGALVGGVLGASMLTLLRSSRHKDKHSPLFLIEKTLAHLGEAMKEHQDQPQKLLKDIDKKIEKNEDLLVTILELTSSGIQLWKRLKK